MERMTRGQAMAMAKEIARAMQAAQKLVDKYGEDRVPGTVIRFSKKFIEGNWDAFPLTPQRRMAMDEALMYDYAGIRASNGLWYLTGRSLNVKTDGLEWEELLDWLDNGVTVERIEFWPPTINGEVEGPKHAKVSTKQF